MDSHRRGHGISSLPRKEVKADTEQLIPKSPASGKAGKPPSPGQSWRKLRNAVAFSSRVSGPKAVSRVQAAPDLLSERVALYEALSRQDEQQNQSTEQGGAVRKQATEQDEPKQDPTSRKSPLQGGVSQHPAHGRTEAPNYSARRTFRSLSVPRGNSINIQARPGALGDSGEEAGHPEKGSLGNMRRLDSRTFRPRGRIGVESLQVKYDKRLYCWMTDIYVTCLKMPLTLFILTVFAAPILLSLAFTPLFLVSFSGLQFGERTLPTWIEAESVNVRSSGELVVPRPLCFVRWAASVIVHVFLYSLSLSTTFGGSPVSAKSPFTLILSNMNTVAAEFLFVFLSGAVFARLSRPGRSVRCAKKAIIRADDYVPAPATLETPASPDTSGEQPRVLATRLVLCGPDPCELIDVSVRWTLRFFRREDPSAPVSIVAQDLNLVRSQVPFLQYGMFVRHIIDESSPIHGHTLESLMAGDACFSLTVTGTERVSMETVFESQDYYAHDGDVVWGGDFEDHIYSGPSGQRILDHSKTDSLKAYKAGAKLSSEDGSPPEAESHVPDNSLSCQDRMFSSYSVAPGENSMALKSIPNDGQNGKSEGTSRMQEISAHAGSRSTSWAKLMGRFGLRDKQKHV